MKSQFFKGVTYQIFTLFNIFEPNPLIFFLEIRNMKVKIDTKEKMHVISVEDEKLAANMTEDLRKTLLKFLDEPVKNVVVNFAQVEEMDGEVADILVSLQQAFYDAGHSMVFCNFQAPVEKFLDDKELLELMNFTPTESEAGDIVQMEEIERELLL